MESEIIGLRDANNERFFKMPGPLFKGHFLTEGSQIPSAAQPTCNRFQRVQELRGGGAG